MDAREQLLAVFPITSDLVALELPGSRSDEDGIVLTVRLIVFDGPEGERRIRDIKEQEVRVRATQLSEPHFAAFIDGWRLALTEVFTAVSAADDPDPIACQMPYDLFDVSALRLKRPQSADDFCDVLLKPGRLGALLPPQ